jgi:inorganic triphosphatase YgiF
LTTLGGYRLGAWVNKLRQKQGGMSAQRKAQLDALGFVWDTRAAQCEEGLGYLQAYVTEHGHCRVPDDYVAADGYRLGQWVRVQRRTEATMPAERKTRLDALGFVWDILAYQWEEGFQHLKAYASEHGHCLVPSAYKAEDEYRLGQWVKVQRRRESTMPADQKARLDALGFVWDILAYQWEEGFQHLKAYVTEHGHCRVPSAHKAEDGYRLGQWVTVQRRRESTMPANQKARLDALGFVWSAKDDTTATVPSYWRRGPKS